VRYTRISAGKAVRVIDAFVGSPEPFREIRGGFMARIFARKRVSDC